MPALAEREPGRVRVIAAGGPPEKVFARLHPVLPEDLRWATIRAGGGIGKCSTGRGGATWWRRRSDD